MNVRNEIWKPIKDYEDHYSISNFGRVRRENTNSNTKKGLILKANHSNRYPRVNLWKDGKCETAYIHRLLANAFLGPAPNGCEVNHIDGDPSNFDLSNLEYVTHKENMQHAHDTKLTNPATGSSHGKSKITEDVVRELRRNANCSPERLKKLAKKHGISRRHAYHIMKGERWQHLEYLPGEEVRS